MKYSEKQIRKAFLEWGTFERLNPNKVMSDIECNLLDIEDLSNEKADYLIKIMNK